MKTAAESKIKDLSALKERGQGSLLRRPATSPSEIAKSAFQDTARKIDAVFARQTRESTKNSK